MGDQQTQGCESSAPTRKGGAMSDQRRDYGPAGCAEGCATRGAQLLILAGILFALLRRKR